MAGSLVGCLLLLVLLLAPLFTGFVRKVKARLLRRQGAPLIQPYLDLVRLSRKDVVLADSNKGYWATNAPLVIRNHVLVGLSGDFDNLPGELKSIDAVTGVAAGVAPTSWAWAPMVRGADCANAEAERVVSAIADDRATESV